MKFSCFNIATGKPPWQEFSNNLAALFHVATSKHPPPIPSELSQDCTHFIERLDFFFEFYFCLFFLKIIFLINLWNRCMKIDPRERSTARELLMDPFLLALIVTSQT